jgi:hypothetical protein
MIDPLSTFSAFVEAVAERLAKGEQQYGNASFDRPIPELLDELQQEALDLAGWGFILWARLQTLQSKVSAPPDSERGKEGERAALHLRFSRAFAAADQALKDGTK